MSSARRPSAMLVLCASTLIDQDLGDGQAARYRRLVDDDPQLGLEITALAPPEFASAASRVSEAIALLDAAGRLNFRRTAHTRA